MTINDIIIYYSDQSQITHDISVLLQYLTPLIIALLWENAFGASTSEEITISLVYSLANERVSFRCPPYTQISRKEKAGSSRQLRGCSRVPKAKAAAEKQQELRKPALPRESPNRCQNFQDGRNKSGKQKTFSPLPLPFTPLFSFFPFI